MKNQALNWQSKLILLLVLPAVACGVLFDTQRAIASQPTLAVWVLGLGAALGILTLALRAATPFAAFTGAVITAQLVYATADWHHFEAWRTFLVPVLAVALLAHIATRIGRARKEKLGTAEARHGRAAAQVAANLGAAALFCTSMAGIWAWNSRWVPHKAGIVIFASLAAMAEAAADTVSSEIGQVFGGRPIMITTLRQVEPGTDGGISVAGSIAGIAAAAVVASLTTVAVGGSWRLFGISLASAVFGLFFDSLLGATLERWGWLNNDGVNFLSTVSAAAFALVSVAAFN